MAQATRPPSVDRSPGPTDRLPRLAAPINRGREIRIGVLGVLGIAVLVIGIPVALAVLVGYPLPRSAPSSAWLTQTITATLIIKILACVVWVLWAHFTVCVLAEWRALRRGRLPGTIPLGGGSQALARRLVAAALLLAGAATTFGNLATHASGPATASSTRQVATATQTPGRHASARTGSAASSSRAAASHAGGQHAGGAAEQGAKSYTVQPPEGRNYDCLWDIAQRTLGDPMRYKEIFALNKDRTQADGSKLVDANLIRPGWQLRLPADASGPGVHVAHAPTASPPVAAPAQDAAPATPASHGATQHVPAGAAVRTRADAETRSAGTGGSSWDSDLLGGGLMLAGLVLALTARRGPYARVSDDEQALTAAADLGLARSVDRALRNLAAARRDQQRALPQPVLAWASADEISLALAGGDTGDPPAPWRAGADATWVCRLAELVDHPELADTAAPYPGLLCVGRAGGSEVFVDFEQAPGLISIGGDDERGRDLVTSLAAQAVTCAWSDGATETLVGFGDGAQLAAMDSHSVDHAATLADLLDDLERRQDDLARLQSSLGVDGVLHGRQSRRSALWAPHFVVLSGSPTADEARRLQQLVGDGRSQIVVLVVGDLAHAAWRFAIDADRTLDLGVLGASVRAHQLDRNSMLQLIDTLRAADTAAVEQAGAVAGLAPAQALASSREHDPSGGAALAVRAGRPGAAPVQATVTLLGPVAVEGPGELAADRRDLATEIVVAVALAPTGIPQVVLRSAIWPRGVSDDVVAAAMRDAGQWLGRDGAGRPALREVDGRWLLGPSVRIDWEEFQLAAAASSAARGPAELAALLQGISLWRGAAFSGVPAPRYGWLSFHRCARDAAVLGTSVARRAAQLLIAQDRFAEAEDVLRRGLVLVPTAEPLWRDLLDLTGRQGPDAAAAVATDMYAVLRAHRMWAQPETDALVAQLAPGAETA